MKLIRLIPSIVGVAFSISIFSCDSYQSDSFANVDLIPVKLSEKGKWSMVNSKGEIVYEDEFKSRPTLAYNGFFSVEEEDNYVVYKVEDKNPKQVKNLEKLKDVGFMEEGLMPVTFPKSRIAIVDENGTRKFELEPAKGAEIVMCDPGYSDERLLFRTSDNKYGYYDTKGKVVIEPKYDIAFTFSEGYALVGQTVKDDDDETLNFSVIDKVGEVVFKVKEGYSVLSGQFNYGYIVLSKDDRIYFFNTKGEDLKLSANISDVKQYNDKFIIFKKDGEYGVADFNDEIIVRPKYELIMFNDDNSFIAKKNPDDKELVLIDSKGDEKSEKIDYETLNNIGKFGYIAKEGKTSLLLDKNFKKKCKDEFFEIGFAQHRGSIFSDYFDYSAVAKDLISQIQGKKVCGLALGSKVSEVMKDESPSSYTYKSSCTVPDFDVDGFKYSMSADALFTTTMADYQYNYYGPNTYYWNSNCYLGAVTVKLKTDKEWGKEGFSTTLGELKKAGFKTVKKGGLSALLKNGSIIILLSVEDNRCEMLVTSNAVPGLSEIESALIRNISSNDDSDEVVEAVEEAVVDVTEVVADSVVAVAE